MSDLSRRLAKLEQQSKPAAGALVVVFGEDPLPPFEPGAQALRVVFVQSNGDGRMTSGARHV